MSLLTSLNSGSATQPYAIQNVSLDGTIPCIGTNGVGTVRVQSNAGVSNIQTDLAAAGTLRLGSDATSFQNVVLTSAATRVNTDLTLGAAGVAGSGDIIFANGGTGSSITGYYSQTTGPVNVPDGGDTVVANPAGLTQGYYIIGVATAAGGQNQQQVSTLAYRTAGGLWAIGGCCSSIAGAGRFGLNVSVDRTTMLLSNSTGAAQNNLTVYFSKLLN